MLNIYEQVDRNKRQSLFVMVSFVCFVGGFIWILNQVIGADPGFIGGALIFSLLFSVSSYFWGDKIILATSQAKPAKRDEYFDFYTVAENLAIASQIPVPKLYVIESPAMNAFATGRSPKHAIICATTGLLKKLNRNELEGVIAHEISHILDYDIRLMTIVAILVGTIGLLSNWTLRTQSLNREDRQKTAPVLLIIGLLAIIFAPLISKLIQLAISRRREYLADASAVKLTRYPPGLISALKKLAACREPLKNANLATAHLYIVNPKISNLFSTHPPIEKRIAALEKMI